MKAERKELVEEGFKASRSFLDAIVDRLEHKLDEKIRDSESFYQLKENNWELAQSYNYGYRQALRDFIEYFVDNKTKDKK